MSRSGGVKRNASSSDLEKKDKAMSLAEQKQRAKEWSIKTFSPQTDDSPSPKATPPSGGGAAGKKRTGVSIEEPVVEVKRARVTNKSKKEGDQILSPIAQSLKNYENVHTPDDEDSAPLAPRFRPISKQTPHPKKSKDTTPTLVSNSPPTVVMPGILSSQITKSTRILFLF